jgi:inhibitor of KinA sporulation pathway (predicted exonuclease)
VSAELVDPFATPPPDRLKTADMCEDITARLQRAQYDDAPLYPQLMQHVLRELARESDPRKQHSRWARALLEQLHHRAVTGVQWDEPQEPDWSLDSERRLPR